MWPVSGSNGSAPAAVSQGDGQALGGSIIVERYIIPAEHAPAVLSLLRISSPFPVERKEPQVSQKPVAAKPDKSAPGAKGSEFRRQRAKTLRIGRKVHRELERRDGKGPRFRKVLAEIAGEMGGHTTTELDAFVRFYRKRAKDIRLGTVRRLVAGGLSLVRIGEHLHVSPQYAGRLVQEATASNGENSK